MSRVCVIGGSGFLGSHVADALVQFGHDVRIFDRIPSPWLQDSQEMIVGDLMDENLVESAVKDCQYVYNFAAIADLNYALTKPMETARINILGNLIAMEACRRQGVSRFMYASTIYVFSKQGGFYRCSKQSAEHYVEEYQQTCGLEYSILRYGSLYGPRSDSSNGLFRIVKQALETGKIQYEGNPESVREYIHVLDAAHASVLALDSMYANESVILTGSQPMKVLELLKMLSEIMGLTESIECLDETYDGHYVRTPYAYQPKLGKKFAPSLYVDLGQGLLGLIDDVSQHTKKGN